MFTQGKNLQAAPTCGQIFAVTALRMARVCVCIFTGDAGVQRIKRDDAFFVFFYRVPPCHMRDGNSQNFEEFFVIIREDRAEGE